MTDIKAKLDELVKNSNYFVASPDTIEQLKSLGLPIKSVMTSYKEYLDKLFEKRRNEANNLIDKLPLLNDKIANGSVSFLYEEFKECFLLGIPGASIVLSILLLDLSAKFRLFEERKNVNSKASWKPIEEMLLREVIIELRNFGVIDDDEEQDLLVFNRNIRNNYLHYNIQKLVKDMILEKLPSFDLKTGETTFMENVKASNYPMLWFSAKKVLDEKSVIIRSSFCVDYTNIFMTRPRIAEERT